MTDPTPDFQHALITGASRGLGLSLATRLAEGGTAVTLVARESDALGAALDAIRAMGGRAHAIAADVGTRDLATRVVGEAAAVHGPIDLLVHNASTLGPTPMPALLDLAPAAFARVVDVNLLGPFELTLAVAGAMALAGRGTIAHLSSDAAVEAYAGWGAYSATKAALDHLARVWASELDGTGVRFVAYDPGEMATAMHAAAMPDADRSQLASPGDVARRLLADLTDHASARPSGARVVLSEVSR